MKFLCVHTSTQAFDDHRVELQGDGIDVQLRLKNRSDFDRIKKGDEVELQFGPAKEVIAKAKRAPKAKRAKVVEPTAPVE